VVDLVGFSIRNLDHAPLVPARLTLQGVLVGLLTGIAGVGGGFAIVPALVLLAGLPMALASGTSLLLIAVNALVALAALGHWPGSNLSLMAPLLVGGAIGSVAGQRLASHLSDRRLRQGFSLLLIGAALLTASEAWRRQPSHSRLPPGQGAPWSTLTRIEPGHQPRPPAKTATERDPRLPLPWLAK